MVAMVNHTALKLGSSSHAVEDQTSLTSTIVEECEAENRTSSSVSQVNTSVHYLLSFEFEVIERIFD